MSYYQLADIILQIAKLFVYVLQACLVIKLSTIGQTIDYQLSHYRSLSRCLGYRTHRPAEEQDPSAGDPRGEVSPRGGQNCGHGERQDHRGGNLPSALGPGQGVRGFSHPVHSGIYIEQEKNEDANSFFVVLGTSLTRAPHGHNGYLLSFYSLSAADRGFAYIATPEKGTYDTDSSLVIFFYSSFNIQTRIGWDMQGSVGGFMFAAETN